MFGINGEKGFADLDLLINNNITGVRLVNNIDLNTLNCYARSICIAANSLKKYSVYSILLFLNKAFQDDLNFNDGFIKIIRDKYNKEGFYEQLFKLISEGKAVIFCFDKYYHQLYRNDYMSKHHLHFSVVRGYDFKKNEIITIDEDIDNLPKTTKEVPIYSERRVDAKHFESACINTGIFIDNNPLKLRYIQTLKDTNISAADSIEEEVDLRYIKIESADGNDSPSDIDTILSNYKVFLYNSLDINKKIIEIMRISLLSMKGREPLITTDLDVKSYLYELSYFPWEISKIKVIESGYATKEQIYNIIFQDMSQYDDTRKLLNMLNKHIRMVILLLNKHIMTRKENEISILTEKHLPELLIKERNFIYGMINFIDQNKDEIKAAMVAGCH